MGCEALSVSFTEDWEFSADFICEAALLFEEELCSGHFLLHLYNAFADLRLPWLVQLPADSTLIDLEK